MKLFRFELAFDGIPQEIGVMTGLDEIGLRQDVAVNIESDFNELYVPHLCEEVSFWFTELGAQTYQPTIDFLAEHSRELNWQILYAEMPEGDVSKAIYTDEFQVAFPAGMVKALCPQYRELTSVRDILRGN